MNTAKFGKTSIVCSIRLRAISKYSFLESQCQQMVYNVFLWDTSIERILQKIENLLKYFAIFRPDSGELKISFNHFGCSYTLSIHKNHLRNKNLGQRLFKKHLKFQKFEETLYCGMTRLRNTNFDAFIQCQYTRTALRKKNMGQSLFKKYWKF